MPVLLGYALVIVAGLVTARGQYVQGKARAKMYNYQAAVNRQNQELLRQQTAAQEEAIKQTALSNITAAQNTAALESGELARNVNILKGSQIATIGALGIGGVTAADIGKSTFDRAKLDQFALRYNANVKSFQFREQSKQDIFKLKQESASKDFALGAEATQFDFAAKHAKKMRNIKVTSTLLGTAGTVAGGMKFGSKTTTTSRGIMTV